KLRSQATQSRWQRVHLSPVRGDWAVISGVRAKGLILNTPVSQVVQRVNTWNARDRHEEFVAAACIIHLRGGAGEILRAYYYTAAIWRLWLRLTWSQRSWHSLPESEAACLYNPSRAGVAELDLNKNMQIRNITWECPDCHVRLKPTEFRIVWGSGGK